MKIEEAMNAVKTIEHASIFGGRPYELAKEMGIKSHFSEHGKQTFSGYGFRAEGLAGWCSAVRRHYEAMKHEREFSQKQVSLFAEAGQ